MRARTNRVPFTEIVGPDAAEVEFDPTTDYLVIRSLFGYPTREVREFMANLAGMGPDSPEEDAVAITLALMDRTIVEWHLIGPDGEPVPRPRAGADFDALPGAIRASLFPFLATFRGRPDPTPAE